MPMGFKSSLPRIAEAKKERQEYADLRRGSSYARGYDNDWRRTRLAQLTEYPLCHDCLKEDLRYNPATEVHHILKLADRPDLKHDPNNLMSLCKKCHSTRTNRGE